MLSSVLRTSKKIIPSLDNDTSQHVSTLRNFACQGSLLVAFRLSMLQQNLNHWVPVREVDHGCHDKEVLVHTIQQLFEVTCTFLGASQSVLVFGYILRGEVGLVALV